MTFSDDPDMASAQHHHKPLAEPSAPPDALQQLIASIQNDSRHWPQPLRGYRSTRTWPRALLLSAGDRELDLQISPQGDRWQLVGQVLGTMASGKATLSNGERRVATELNTLGEFILPAVAQGLYTLTITHGDLEIVVPNLEMGIPS